MSEGGRAATRAGAPARGPRDDYLGDGGPGLELVDGGPPPGGGPGSGPPERVSREDLREVHREIAREELESPGQEGCGREPVPVEQPAVYREADSGRLYWWGLRRCDNATSCPTCAPRIARERAEALEERLRRHLEAGGGILMLTPTAPHHAGHRLGLCYQVISKSWSRLKASAPWKRWRERIGYVGTVTAHDCTHGAHGWHVHKHALVLTEEPVAEEVVEEMERELGQRWADRVVRWYWSEAAGELRCRRIDRRLPKGHKPALGRPSREHGLKLQTADRGAAWYVSKLGVAKEVTRVDAKRAADGHRTPFQILADLARHGRPEDRELWTEYCRTMKAKPALVYSPGLKERLELLPWIEHHHAQDHPPHLLSPDLPLPAQRQLQELKIEELRDDPEPDDPNEGAEEVVRFSPGLWRRLYQADSIDNPRREILARLSDGAELAELAWWIDGQLGPGERAVLSPTGELYALVENPNNPEEWDRL